MLSKQRWVRSHHFPGPVNREPVQRILQRRGGEGKSVHESRFPPSISSAKVGVTFVAEEQSKSRRQCRMQKVFLAVLQSSSAVKGELV